MANTSSIFSLQTETLAQFLAKTVVAPRSGTNEQVFNALKVDEAGEEADGSEIASATGQLWGNGMDDFMQAVYMPYLYKAHKIWRRVDAAARDALGSDDALAVADLCSVDGDTLYRCVSVDGPTSSTWTSIAGAAPVDSVFGRTGVVVAAASDYDASQVDNDSGVAGATVANALDTLAGLVGGDLDAVLTAGNNSGTNDIEMAAGQAVRGVDSAGAAGGTLTERAGDYTGVGTDNGGAYTSRGGDTSSTNTSSDGGLWTGRGGNAADGTGGGVALHGGTSGSRPPGAFDIGGNLGAQHPADSTVIAPGTTANQPAGDLISGGGTSTGGGFNGSATWRGGEPSVSDSNNRPGGDATFRGGDGGGQGLTGTHGGGSATSRGGDGEGFGTGGNYTTRAGNSGAGSNAEGGDWLGAGGSSTGNRKGGEWDAIGGAASGTGDGGDVGLEGGSSVSGSKGKVIIKGLTHLMVGIFADANRGAAGTNGRVIFNTDDGNLNIDDGTNWILPDGTIT